MWLQINISHIEWSFSWWIMIKDNSQSWERQIKCITPCWVFEEDCVDDRSIFMFILVWTFPEADFESKDFIWDVIAENPSRGWGSKVGKEIQ